MSSRILVVDDEPNLRELLRIMLEGEGYLVQEAASFREAASALTRESFHVAICDIFLPDGNGLDLLRTFRSTKPDTQFVVITAHSTPVHLLTALREGAVEYLSKPFDLEELKLVVAKQAARTHSSPMETSGNRIAGRSRAMWTVLERLPQVARSDATVLLTGESGTGKELLARTIHADSPRAGGLFVPVNCGALPEGLLESELFGHVRGSFTGAVRDKRGLMQEANGGTLFLDEVGEIPPSIQVKLLRALQDKRVRSVGDNREVAVDVRVICATNQDLQQRIREGSFRDDLFYRINVIHLEIPPLRDRQEDIPELAFHFVERACQRLAVPVKELHRDVLTVLTTYSWPGNIRELENVMERAVALESSTLITLSSLPENLLAAAAGGANRAEAGLTFPREGLDLETHLEAIRRELMAQALERCGGVQKEAARLLNISYRAFRYHADKFNLTGKE